MSTSSSSLHPFFKPNSVSNKLLATVALAFLADRLFWNPLFGDLSKEEIYLGWIYGLFMASTVLVSIALNGSLCRSFAGRLWAALAFVQCLAMIDYPSTLNLILFIACSSIYALQKLGVNSRRGVEWMRNAVRYSIFGPFGLIADSRILRRVKARRSSLLRKTTAFSKIALPVVMGTLFLSLFSLANPIFEARLSEVTSYIAKPILIWRALFWLGMMSLCWALVRPSPQWRKFAESRFVQVHEQKISTLFNDYSVFISLVMFNVIFAIQNLLDFEFLWSGQPLPEDISIAEYAHRGAYPLVATALLAAGFVLLATRESSELKKRRDIIALVYLWVGQNIFLLISSILRLNFYVEQYSLTYLRVAAFIWMGLVGCGLLLIVAKLYLHRTSAWLVNANLVLLFTAMYAASLINFGVIIAEYNVSHCREMSHEGPRIDYRYLADRIGPRALPALERLRAESNPGLMPRPDANNPTLGLLFQDLEWKVVEVQCRLRRIQHSWREWTFSEFRTAKELKLDDTQC